MFCKHKWEILSEITTKSKVEHAVELGMKIKRSSEDVCERKHIQVITCSKCGKLKRFVENI